MENENEAKNWYQKCVDFILEKELENASPTELVEYSKEIARIAAKIAEVAY